MNVIYAKTILHLYAVSDSVIDQLEELCQRKAFSSISDFSPCFDQCLKIVGWKLQKQILLDIKEIVNKILSKLSKLELDYLDYKYFKKNPKDYYKDFDFSSRNYFRRQNKLALKISDMLEKNEFSDDWFINQCKEIEFFKEMLKRVKEKESLGNKNKPLKEKLKQEEYQNKLNDKNLKIHKKLIGDSSVKVSTINTNNKNKNAVKTA